VREYLEEKYGKDLLETGGLKIYTSLDPKLQEEAERIVSERAAANEAKF
jgi:membrane peptidoglycan carboxypeptidase